VRRLRAAAAACILVAASGCATTASDPRDPLEGMNRGMMAVNDVIDEAFLIPVAKAYKYVTPGPLRVMVRNFFANIEDLMIGVNNLLQGKPAAAGNDWARFAFNSIFGVFGINDVASEMGFEKHAEDFGQTFGRWGVGPGPYLVLPVVGPSTLRDAGGFVADVYADPVTRVEPVRVRNAADGLRLFSRRADLLDASQLLEDAALDRYVFLRDAFLQRRQNLIYDGRPPREPRPPQEKGEEQ